MSNFLLQAFSPLSKRNLPGGSGISSAEQAAKSDANRTGDSASGPDAQVVSPHDIALGGGGPMKAGDTYSTQRIPATEPPADTFKLRVGPVSDKACERFFPRVIANGGEASLCLLLGRDVSISTHQCARPMHCGASTLFLRTTRKQERRSAPAQPFTNWPL